MICSHPELRRDAPRSGLTYLWAFSHKQVLQTPIMASCVMVSFLDCLSDIFAHVTLAYTIRTYRWYVPTIASKGVFLPLPVGIGGVAKPRGLEISLVC